MNLSVTRKAFMPLMAAGLFACGVACNRKPADPVTSEKIANQQEQTKTVCDSLGIEFKKQEVLFGQILDKLDPNWRETYEKSDFLKEMEELEAKKINIKG